MFNSLFYYYRGSVIAKSLPHSQIFSEKVLDLDFSAMLKLLGHWELRGGSMHFVSQDTHESFRGQENHGLHLHVPMNFMHPHAGVLAGDWLTGTYTWLAVRR